MTPSRGLLSSLLPALLAAFAPAAAAGEADDLAARRAFAEGQVQRAADLYQATVRSNPFDVTALNNLAVAKANQGDYQGAVSLLERASRLAPQRPDIAANLKAMRNLAARGTDIHPGGVMPPVMATPLPPEPPPLWPAVAQPTPYGAWPR